jgi:Pathogenicity locus
MTYRHLLDVPSVGPRALEDLHLLGVHSVPQLAAADPDELFVRLERLTGVRQDPCVLDSLRCAVYAAHDPTPDPARLQWWWWSWARKAGHVGAVPGR